MATKSLSVLGDDGVGKKTLIGSLIYKCGLQLPQLEELEREGIRRFAEIVPFYEKKGHIQSFHGPSGPFVIGESKTPDVCFWVVDASDPANWSSSVQKLASLLSSGTLQPREKLFILANKMDLVSWSDYRFGEIVRTFSATDSKTVCTYIVPISSLHGDNLLTSPKEPSWVRDISASQFGGSECVSEQPLMYLLK